MLWCKTIDSYDPLLRWMFFAASFFLVATSTIPVLFPLLYRHASINFPSSVEQNNVPVNSPPPKYLKFFIFSIGFGLFLSEGTKVTRNISVAPFFRRATIRRIVLQIVLEVVILPFSILEVVDIIMALDMIGISTKVTWSFVLIIALLHSGINSGVW